MLSVTVAGIEFPSLLLNASGAFHPATFNRIFDLGSTLGGIVTKTVTAAPTIGNAQHRTVELPGIGMLNSIGLQNPGLDYFLEQEAAALKAYGLPLILSISAHSNHEFAEMAHRVQSHPSGHHVDALELNLSCPNVEKGGIHFGTSADCVQGAVASVVQVFEKPVFAKLTPNVADIVSIGGAALEGGAHGLTAINTVMGASIDIKRKKPGLQRVSGGYSGPGIRPVAIHAVYQLHKHFPEAPILGVGGIMNANDVLEFLMAGASLVQVGTACFRTPTVFTQIQEDLMDYCQAEGLSRLTELTGCAHPQTSVTV